MLESLNGDSWTVRAGRRLLNILVERAKSGQTIYYSEAANLLEEQGITRCPDVKYGGPAGVVGNALMELAEVKKVDLYPPLNALVVAKINDLPGEGVDYYLSKYLKVPKVVLEGSKRAEYVYKVQNDAFAYPYWDKVLEDLEQGSSVPDIIPRFKLPEGERPGGVGSGGEGSNHRRLKCYVAKHPQKIGLNSEYQKNEPEIERKFVCADRVDVFFHHPKSPVAVECKTIDASEAELISGIFQCVKYKSLLKAEMIFLEPKFRKNWKPKSILAVENDLSHSLRCMARMLDIEWYKIEYDE
jgi:hypothetical protein